MMVLAVMTYLAISIGIAFWSLKGGGAGLKSTRDKVLAGGLIFLSPFVLPLVLVCGILWALKEFLTEVF